MKALMSPTGRKKLPEQDRPFFHKLEEGLYIAYRQGSRRGRWMGRVRIDGRYRDKYLADADDEPGTGVPWGAAVAMVRSWAKEQIEADRRAKNGDEPAPSGPYRVKDAARDYIADYIARGGRGLRTVQSGINLHIVPHLGDVELRDLTSKRITKWMASLAASPRNLRTAKMAKKRNIAAEAPKTAEEKRQRMSTANGARTILVALLNHAFTNGQIGSDVAWRKTKPFKGVSAARVRYLSLEEVTRLTNACARDLRSLVWGAVQSGGRYGELGRLVASDFREEAKAIFIQFSKSGRSRFVPLSDEGVSFFAQATAGKASNELIFRKQDGEPWGETHQFRPLRAACERAKIAPPINFHALRHTYASQLVMAGTPLMVVAKALGHADSRICEAHYAHLSPSYVAEMIREKLPSFGFVPESNVAPMKRRAKK
jgi:integrase